MSLAAQIRELIDGELTNREIAEQLDCCQDYVRAVRGRYLRPHIQQAWNATVRQTERYREINRQASKRWYWKQKQAA